MAVQKVVYPENLEQSLSGVKSYVDGKVAVLAAGSRFRNSVANVTALSAISNPRVGDYAYVQSDAAPHEGDISRYDYAEVSEGVFAWSYTTKIEGLPRNFTTNPIDLSELANSVKEKFGEGLSEEEVLQMLLINVGVGTAAYVDGVATTLIPEDGEYPNVQGVTFALYKFYSDNAAHFNMVNVDVLPVVTARIYDVNFVYVRDVVVAAGETGVTSGSLSSGDYYAAIFAVDSQGKYVAANFTLNILR
ncbi:MAG: hypothetical protein LBP59_10465 [Planctomycetaceae bacterium]|jgi:hypothetical protein|nr:hypothetical protein [Planctomycetaceae bacterium]